MSISDQQNKSIEPLPPSLLKGLQPFEPQDAELLRKLQREQDILRIAQTIASEHFIFGVLNGVSGCGKTSFLQAGLQPALQEAGYLVIYVKFSDAPPLECIRRACAQAIGLQLAENTDLLSLLQELTGSRQKPWFFLFDQFEQLFTHTQDQQNAFIEDLSSWYLNHHQYVGKILISIRSDMLDLLYECQKKLGYALTPQLNYFQLSEFSPEQATETFRMMAADMQVEFDEKFIQQMCTEELASTETGLISAVDIQILAMILQGQQTATDRAFNRQAFERMGGIEGLLQRYVQAQLDTPSMYNKNQGALNVLLALVDLNYNVRAGLLTLSQIQAKLEGIVPAELLPGILQWLCSLRLLTKRIEADQDAVYELAHERLIIPLRNVARKTLSRIDHLSQRLDRRINEWLGNGRARRYLFNLSELWDYRKYRRLIIWEPNRSEKEALIAVSWGWWKKRLWAVSGFFALLFALGTFFSTPTGMLVRVRYWDFPQSLMESYSEACAAIAPILVNAYPELTKQTLRYIQQPEQVLATLLVTCDSLMSDSNPQLKRILEFYGLAYRYLDSVESVYSRTKALSALAVMAGELAKYTKDASHLTQGEALAKKIEDAYYSDEALSTLVLAAGELAKYTKALDYLTQGEEFAKKIESAFSRVQAVCALAVAAGELGQKIKALDYLTQGEEFAKKIDIAFSRVQALGSLAVAAGELGQKTKALDYLTQGEALAKEIKRSDDHDGGLASLAFKALELAKHTKDGSYLTLGCALAKEIEDTYDRAKALSALAVAALELAKHTKDASYLTQGEFLAKKIEDAYSRAHVLSMLAVAAGELGQKAKALDYLAQGEVMVKKIEDADSRAHKLSELAVTAGELGQKTKALNYLTQSATLAKNNIRDVDSRAEVLKNLVITACVLKHWKTALSLTQSMPSNSQAIGYAWILRLWSQRHKAPKKDK